MMKKYGVVLLFIVGLSLLGIIPRGPSACALQGSKAPVESVQPPMSMPSQLVVYYFHGNARCASCYKLEQYSKEAVEQNFAQELKEGKIVFMQVNTDRRENAHFVQDYQLYTKSVVLSLVKNGQQVRYKNLERIWDLLRDPKKYHDYIRDEIKPFLEAL